jgi:hypothetical protein
MDNPEKTEEAMKNGQYRENRRGNEEWTIQRKQKRQCHSSLPLLFSLDCPFFIAPSNSVFSKVYLLQ